MELGAFDREGGARMARTSDQTVDRYMSQSGKKQIKRPTFQSRLDTTARRFARDETGSMLVFCLILFVIMVAAVGYAIDIMRFEYQRASLQYNLDNAVLAAADLDQLRDGDAVVIDYLSKAGLGDFISDTDITVENTSINSKTVTATATRPMNSLFQGTGFELADLSNLSIPAASQAKESVEDVEISLVLDVSGSMAGSKLTSLVSAANEFVTTVLEFENDQDNNGSGENIDLSISVVPYAQHVSVPTSILNPIPTSDEQTYSRCITFFDSDFNTTAIDLSGATTYNRTYHFDRTNYDSDDSEYRDGLIRDPVQHIGQFADPECRTWASRLVLPFQNDETTIHNFISNLYASGNTSIDVGVKWGAALLDNSMAPIINQMIADGQVHADFQDRPAPVVAGETAKIMVVMTDGANTNQYYIDSRYRGAMSNAWFHESTERYSYYESWRDNASYNYRAYYQPWRSSDDRWQKTPYSSWAKATDPDTGEDIWELVEASRQLSFAEMAAHIPLDYIQSSSRHERAMLNGDTDRSDMYNWWGGTTKDARTRAICDASKANGIIIYTIAFQAQDAGKAVLKDCASSDAQYFDISGLNIGDAFKAIASSIRKLKLTQ